MYVVRTEKGETFTSTEWGENNGKEIVYSTYEEAQKDLEQMQHSFLDAKLKVLNVKESEV